MLDRMRDLMTGCDPLAIKATALSLIEGHHCWFDYFMTPSFIYPAMSLDLPAPTDHTLARRRSLS